MFEKNEDVRILFVDNDTNEHERIKHILSDMGKNWRFNFAASGEEALDATENTSVDVIVVDMFMPEMDGVELLENVKAKHPDIVRFILGKNGHTELIQRSVGVAHQFIPKPCEADFLKTAIRKAGNIRARLQGEQIASLVGEVNTLPSLPPLYEKLKEELKNPECDINKVAEIINQDVAMSTKILHLVNSAFFAMPHRIDNVQQALGLLGMETIQSLVLTTGIFEQFSKAEVERFSLTEVFEHSLRVGTMAGKIIKQRVQDHQLTEDAIAAGMMHDVGKLLFVRKVPQGYSAICEESQAQGELTLDAEKQTYGFTHGELGGYLLGLWGFPDAIVEAVTFHHNPNEAVKAGLRPLAAVHAANAVDHGTQTNPQLLDPDYVEALGMTEQVRNLFASV